MGFMQLFHRAPAKWANLAANEKRLVARKMARHFARANYQIVDSPDVMLRGRAVTETGGEDDILSYYKRAEIINFARNGVRNSETLNAILKQFELNCVGTVGGKASFVFGDDSGNAIREAFAKYAACCEFFDGLPFSRVLKIALKTHLLGGDFVILFDDGVINGSGKVLVFEPDCIANIPDGEFNSRFPGGYTQRQGRIYNDYSQFCGVIVSESQRGMGVFKDTSKCFFLTRDPAVDPRESNWTMVRNVWRANQGRGTPPLSASLGSIIDLEDVTKFEVQAAKKNSQTLAQVIQSEAEDPMITGGLDTSTDFTNVTDSQIEEAVQEVGEETVSLDTIRAAGAMYEVMPANAKLELLDTKHPNANMPEFIRWLAGRSAASLGLGSVYATMKADASYTAFRGEQVMSWPAFEEMQKFLEGSVCDWLLRNWSRWADKRGIISLASLPDYWERRVAWQWPRMREVNQVDEQNAIALKLKNGTGSFREIYGADWKARLDEISDEIRYCTARGIIHPATQTVSGQVLTTNKEESNGNV